MTISKKISTLFLISIISLFAIPGFGQKEFSEEEINTASKEILDDLLAIHNKIRQVDKDVLLRELERVEKAQKAGDFSLSFKDFAVDRLGIDSRVFDVFDNYSPLKKELMVEQFSEGSNQKRIQDYWSSNKELFDFSPTKTTNKTNRNDDNEEREPCSPECCGGWRPIRVIGGSSVCVATLNPWACLWNVVDHIAFARDNCWE